MELSSKCFLCQRNIVSFLCMHVWEFSTLFENFFLSPRTNRLWEPGMWAGNENIRTNNTRLTDFFLTAQNGKTFNFACEYNLTHKKVNICLFSKHLYPKQIAIKTFKVYNWELRLRKQQWLSGSSEIKTQGPLVISLKP